MFPRHDRQRHGCDCAKNLRDKNNALSAESIREMTSRQRQRNHRHCDNQTNESKCGRRMGARVKLPFNGHSQHQTTRDRE